MEPVSFSSTSSSSSFFIILLIERLNKLFQWRLEGQGHQNSRCNTPGAVAPITKGSGKSDKLVNEYRTRQISNNSKRKELILFGAILAKIQEARMAEYPPALMRHRVTQQICKWFCTLLHYDRPALPRFGDFDKRK